MAFLRLKAALALLATFNGLLANAQTSTLQELTNFGPNPTNVQMYVYKPLSLPESPALLVANHWCSGSAQDYYQYTRYAQLADTNGYIVLYGNAPDPSKCWDVWSNATLTHDAGGDSLAIASAVRYAIANYNVDPARVYSTGTSSGAMFTNVLLGAYPDLFSAGSLISGVPYGCFAGPTSWNSQCSNGQLIQTGQQWGDLVRSGYPGFTGVRPKVQFWHSSGDDVLYPQNYYEEIKQWTNIFGVSETPTSVVENDPLPDYTRSSWGPNVQGIWAEGRDHSNLYPIEEVVLEWFGLNQPVPSNPPTSSSTVPSSSASETPSSTPSSTPTSVPGTVPQWGQCGGIGYVGATSCVSPFTCTELNPWYFQCL